MPKTCSNVRCHVSNFERSR
ncbi:MAG: CxxxxCH/CxxCH domain-containing protein [Chloroflexi bacterium]|nr:CxxxxCH/CxxCH domain-containing protein [Chloroflexota bacterium]